MEMQGMPSAEKRVTPRSFALIMVFTYFVLFFGISILNMYFNIAFFDAVWFSFMGVALICLYLLTSIGLLKLCEATKSWQKLIIVVLAMALCLVVRFGDDFSLPAINGLSNRVEMTQNSEIKVVLSSEVYGLMETLYKINEDEYNVCMFGSIVNGTYHITGTAASETRKSDLTSLVHKKCPPNTLISTHKHPRSELFIYCSPSNTDQITHSIEELSSIEDRLMGIQCDYNEFAFYRVDEYEESLRWAVNKD